MWKAEVASSVCHLDLQLWEEGQSQGMSEADIEALDEKPSKIEQ